MRHWLCLLFALPALAQASQWLAVEPQPGQGQLHYYASQPANTQARSALIVLHGFHHDARRTFDVGTGLSPNGLVIAPLFQSRGSKCQAEDEPVPQAVELQWSCGGWAQGDPALNAPSVTSFQAMDALIAEVHRQWPSVNTITVAGFSAGAQLVQHYIGFAAPQPGLRFVVADPGSWLYFNSARPYPVGDCPALEQWKYGTRQLPSWLAHDGQAAAKQYAAAEVHYLAGTLDTGSGKGTAYKVLDRSCAAMAQGPFRLERAQAYAQAQGAPLIEAPGCGHDVACVFNAPAARAVLVP
ncbi:hypothetical protein PMM47T1_15001 [Pseudomonas sp. M47T1]|uniref:hypothetical protein n=1 Tax=Pseudomonas sp. M47T1 TaxID=1179778 RepID=UPI0002606F47|nr:hypothetical protein [Pseudomonas sp. M47T1]EIK95704.1 hypothetical protein PMM47T1_15001 [Pseudomonas sp. M47T1]